MKKGQVLFVAVAGAALGGTLALLTAPRLGFQMRRKIIDSIFQKLDGWMQKAENKLDTAYAKAIQSETV